MTRPPLHHLRILLKAKAKPETPLYQTARRRIVGIIITDVADGTRKVKPNPTRQSGMAEELRHPMHMRSSRNTGRGKAKDRLSSAYRSDRFD
jgi:hypothetical protein